MCLWCSSRTGPTPLRSNPTPPTPLRSNLTPPTPLGPAYRTDPAQPQLDVTQLYPSSPGSGSSTPLYDLAEFDSTISSVVMSESPVSDVASLVPCVKIETLDDTSMSTQTASIL